MVKRRTPTKRPVTRQTRQELPGAWSWLVFHVWVGSFIAIYLGMFTLTDVFSEASFGAGFTGFLLKVLSSIAASYFLALMIYGPYVGIKKGITEIRQVSLEADRLQEELEGDFFTNLVKINFKYLDKYYLQTQVQANKSFLLSAAAAVVGLLILAAGIVLMFRGSTDPAYVTVAAGAFSEFISAVFFYLYNKTVIRMSEYHQKLVLTQNIGLSLKISEGLPDEERVHAQRALIGALTHNINLYLSGKADDEAAVRPTRPSS